MLYIESQFTYLYETLSHEGLVAIAQERLDEDVSGWSTQEIFEKLKLAPRNKASQMGPSRQPSSVSNLYAYLTNVV